MLLLSLFATKIINEKELTFAAGVVGIDPPPQGEVFEGCGFHEVGTLSFACPKTRETRAKTSNVLIITLLVNVLKFGWFI